MRRAYVVLTVLGLLSCGGGSAPDGGVEVDAGAGQLLLVFDGDFGDVERFTTATHAARFVNVGDVPAAIARLQVQGDGFSLGTVETGLIPPGESRDVLVHFHPTRNGPHAARISFQATTLPVLAHFSMVGRGVGALANVTPALDLGTHFIRDFQTLNVSGVVRVENVGDRWLYFPAGRAPWAVTPTEELCVGDKDAAGRCTGLVRDFDVAAGIAPGRALELPVHFTSTVPGPRTWKLSLTTALPDAPRFEVPIGIVVLPAPGCRLVADVTGLDFGVVPPVQAVDLPVTLTNLGSGDCVDVAPGFDAEGAAPVFAVLEPAWSRTLASDERVTLTVRAQPDVAAGVQQRLLRFGEHPLSLPVKVTAGAPCLVAEGRFDLGTWAPTCAPPVETVRFQNRCAEPVRVTSVDSPSPDVVLTPQAPLPQWVPAGGAFEVATSLRAGVTNRAVETWWALSSGSAGATQRVARGLRGRAAQGEGFESFTALPKADVLVVVERGASGLVSQARTQLATLHSQLAASGADFRLGVVDSFVGGGRLLTTGAGLRWLSATQGNDADFRAWLTGGAVAGGNALEALRWATTAPLATDDAVNRGFFRPDAALVVLLLGTNAEVDEGQVAALRALKPDGRDVVVHVIAGCAPLSAGVGALVEQTGGTVLWCASSWAPAVDDVIASVNGARARFLVASSPGSGTMSVTAGNGRLPPSMWSFTGPWLTTTGAVPSPVRVTFAPACR